MTIQIIITLCSLLLVAYIFDLTSAKTKIPSVILLLGLGFAAKQVTLFLEISIPNLSDLLPVLGTIGLILIVLEGSLEVEINRSKVPLISKSILSALIPMVGLSFLIAFIFFKYGGYGLKNSLINAIPLCIISSSIAIPSVINLSKASKEFVVYESSFSDIFGVIFFDFIALNAQISSASFLHFIWQFLIMCVVSFVSTLGLAFLLNRIDHHIKFIPIILLIIIIYAVSKAYHLPALIFILIFGLFLGNIDKLRNLRWINRTGTKEINRDVMKFKEIVMEGTFLIRTLFFILFGFLLSTAEIINSETILWALGIVALIFVSRFVQLRISKVPLFPLWFIAPRGLITILLFLAIGPLQQIGLVNTSLIIQVILLTAFIMMLGLILSGKREEVEKQKEEQEKNAPAPEVVEESIEIKEAGAERQS